MQSKGATSEPENYFVAAENLVSGELGDDSVAEHVRHPEDVLDDEGMSMAVCM
jgi:hypothetical protein